MANSILQPGTGLRSEYFLHSVTLLSPWKGFVVVGKSSLLHANSKISDYFVIVIETEHIVW